MDAIKMKSPDGATTCTVGGVTYVSKKGLIKAAIEHVKELLSHGYTIAESDNV